MSRPPLPPFTKETAAQKARMAEDAWNSRDPERVSLAYTEDSRWRNRAEFFEGRAAIVAFLTRKWQKELDYRLIKISGRSTTTASLCGFSTNGTTPAASGIAPTATSNGNSTRTA
jgi:nuclear transport factor 2 (NTF2) superfamily protein